MMQIALPPDGSFQFEQVMVTTHGNNDVHVRVIRENGTVRDYSIKAMQEEIDSLKKQIAELILIGAAK
jgi:hypothetical protein